MSSINGISIRIGEPSAVSVSVSSVGVNASLGSTIAREVVERDPYTGNYSVTPTQETQTLLTNGLRMTDNIVVDPIPQNYGLITYNGSVITVS